MGLQRLVVEAMSAVVKPLWTALKFSRGGREDGERGRSPKSPRA